MENLKILIIENDKNQGMKIDNIVKSFGYHVVGIAKDEIEAFAMFKSNFIDLLIMDIRLKEKEDGIILAQKLLRYKEIPILFLTAHGSFEVREKIKKLNSASFLDKPFYPIQLESAIDFGLHKFSLLVSSDPIENSIEKKGEYFNIGDFFFIKKNHRYIRIGIKDIIYIKSAGACIEIFTDNEKYVFYTKLNKFFEQISHPDLMRVHKSYAINVRYVNSFNSNRVFLITEKLKEEIPIGSTFKKVFDINFFKLKTD